MIKFYMFDPGGGSGEGSENDLPAESSGSPNSRPEISRLDPFGGQTGFFEEAGYRKTLIFPLQVDAF